MALPFMGEAERKPRKKRRKPRKKHHVVKHHPVKPQPVKPTPVKPKPVASTKPTTPAPSPIATPADPILSPNALHLARRFSFGVTPELGAAVNAAGGARAWLLSQLDPASVPDPVGDDIDTWFAFLGRTPEEIYQRQKDGTEGSWVVMYDLSKWTVARRIHSTRQVHEVMVDFWSNLFNVPLGASNGAAYARADYDKTIRARALGTFEDLLKAVTVHPAMGMNLSNASSNANSKAGVNENLGRELLELHTVGFGSGYSEADVKSSAKILSGYRVDQWPAYKAYYDTTWHGVGAVQVMDFSSANSATDGQAVTMAYLSYLAQHPKTAARIARRLCVRFVGDNPSGDIVAAVTKAYVDSGSDIKRTLLALVDHAEFNRSAGTKLRNPQEDWTAMVRALGITLKRPTSNGGDFANAMLWQYKALNAAPYEWSAPNGYPEVNAAWASAGRMLNSFANHRSVAYHWWPGNNVGAITPDAKSFLPPLPATLQTIVDVVGVRVLGEPPSARTAQAIATLTGWSLTRTVTAGEAGSWWFAAAVASTLLDSPQHLYR